MSKTYTLNDQIAAVEAAIMEGRHSTDRQAALGAALKTLRLNARFEAPARRFFMFCISEVAKAEADPTAQQMILAFPGACVTLTVRA